MKAISCPIIINSIRSRKDKSLSFSAETPELSSNEKVAWMDLQGINVKAILKPTDEEPEELLEVDNEVNQKTQSQRIRSVLFLLWKKDGENGDFSNFYREKTEKYINYLKELL